MKKLVTHDGAFHYDEILATAMLMKIIPDAEVVRTRDPGIIEQGDIVYDVGGIFDPAKNRFDHHQRTFSESFSPKHTTKLSSAGLVYKYFCDKLFGEFGFGPAHMLYEEVKVKIYEEFIQYADALDNGDSIFGEIVPRTLPSLVAGFNVYASENEEMLQKMQRDNFNKALEIVDIDLTNYLNRILKDYVSGYMQVYEEMKDLAGDIYVTSYRVSSDLIFSVDAKLGKNVKYVIFKNKADYRVLALPIKRGSFATRVPLLREWCGLRDEDLSKKAGIDGCTFVHATGFTGGNRTLEGAIEMCERSLETSKRHRSSEPADAENNKNI